MKHAINSLEAVRSFYADKGIKIRIRYYNEGKEVSKENAVEFSVSGTDVAFEAPAEVAESAEEVTDAVETPVTEEVVEAVAEPAEEAKNATDAVVEAAKPKKARKGRADSKAHMLREFIRQQKASGEYDYEDTVDWTETTLGFKRPLARVYVRLAAERVDSVELA